MKLSAVIALLLLATMAPASSAQANGTDSAPRTSMSGIFSQKQAAAGRSVYSMQCSACHSTSAHSGPAFMKSWQGRTVWDLYAFLKDNMPQSEPGALSDQEYIQVVSYMLSLNKMPPGQQDLSVDQTLLKSIRIDTTAVAPASGTGSGAPHRR